ncbi:hypothetical protein TrRE_jg1229 [Triparma retinervis]|uniref:Uncharacterized protein n=1 Tax=Triparma retinervis TaxID=2557542 RepID=A0A9W7FWK0_9STRA|nr:hypothetical protein TrRE_jg1229 [Triparma retinervis]
MRRLRRGEVQPFNRSCYVPRLHRRNGEVWLEETGAVAEWRCSTGDGPIDQCRVRYELGVGMQDLMTFLQATDKSRRLLGRNADGTEDMHVTYELPFPLSARESVIRRAVEVRRDKAWIISRTYQGKSARYEVRKGPLRVMCDVHIGGYFLEAVSGRRTKVTYIVGTDLNGVFAMDWMARKATPHHLKANVDRNMEWFCPVEDCRNICGLVRCGQCRNAANTAEWEVCMDCGQKCCTYCMKTGEDMSLEMGAPEGIKLCMSCAAMIIESME